jgi:5S rRNA maturation endonuclease (ribonuclease M5)
MGLREDYLKATKKEKTRILNEYTKNTRHNRKYVIAMLNADNVWANNGARKPRPKRYGLEINAPLVKLWDIFDFPCGQRLKPCITEELERLRGFREINISDKIAEQLKQMSSATIDRRLKVPRQAERRRRFSTTRPGSLLKKKIPIRLTDWDTQKIGFLEVDLVAHCGSSARGDFLNTVSLTEIATGWWEGEAIMGKGQKVTLEAIKLMKQRTPFKWLGLDSDNGGEFINYPLSDYCHDEKLIFTRSRENKKNDNAYVEQKNWTHVRKILGYFRYDTSMERTIINSLYRNELRLYKNFFQPVMKLAEKTRLGAKRHRKYEPAKTPFKRLIESDQIDEATKIELKAVYRKLNPAALKRAIEKKTLLLYRTYQAKKQGRATLRTEKEVVYG